jgi:replicative DNA helicase
MRKQIENTVVSILLQRNDRKKILKTLPTEGFRFSRNIKIVEIIRESSSIDEVKFRIIEKKLMSKTVLRKHLEQKIENIDFYIKKFNENYLIDKFEEAVNKFDKDNVHSSILTLQEDLSKIISPHTKTVMSGDLTNDVLEKIRRDAKKGRIIGIPSGIKSLDEATTGFQPGDLVFISGRPSQGKTALMLDMVRHISSCGYNPCIVSVEMSKERLVRRLIFSSAKINHYDLTSEDPEVKRIAMKRLNKNSDNVPENIVIQDGIYDIDDIVSFIYSIAGKVDIIFLDYMQRIQSRRSFQREDLKVKHFSNVMKNISLSLDVPVVILTQLKRGTLRPENSDLKESGAQEEDADIIIHLFTKGNVMILGKNRDGITKDVPIEFNKRFGIFSEKQRNFNFQYKE